MRWTNCFLGMKLLRSRCIGVGSFTAEEAIALSASGPSYEVLVYPMIFVKLIHTAFMTGLISMWLFDIMVIYYDRYLVRLEEIRQSIRIIQQAVSQIPKKDRFLKVNRNIPVKVPAGERYGRVEGPKGELGFLCSLEWTG